MDPYDDMPTDDLAVSLKRKLDEAVSDISEYIPRAAKLSKLTKINSTLPTEPNDCGAHFSKSQIDTSQECPALSLDSLMYIRNQLSDLTKQKCEIKASMQTLREDVAKDLLATMRTRQLAIAAVAAPSIKGTQHQRWLDVLDNRKMQMYSKEKDLVWLKTQLVSNDARLELVHAACTELDAKIAAHIEESPSEGVYRIDLTEFPFMSRFTNLITILDTSKTHSASNKHVQIPESDRGAFSHFKDLPPELRLHVWEASLPGPRLLTEQSSHNKQLTALATCRESRRLAQSRYIQMVSPSSLFPLDSTPIIIVNPDTDTVIRDLTARDTEAGPLFSRNGIEFNAQCYHMLAGLSRIKHVAIAYDLLRENGGVLFGPVQASCPVLESLTIFPSSFDPISETPDRPHDMQFIEVDSNLLDFISLRWDQIADRKLKRKALRGVTVISTLLSHALQYRAVFPEYIGRFGRYWKPVIKVCILARWNERYRGWQIQSLDGDRYSKGFPGEDGVLHRGFLESRMVGDREHGLYSRYDGLEVLFREDASC